MKTRKLIMARAFALALAASGLLIATLGFSSGTGTNQIAMKNVPSQPYVPDELLVKFKAGVSIASQAQSLASLGTTKLATLSQPGWTHVKLPASLGVPQALAAYAGDANVEAAQPNYIYHLTAVPNDTNYVQQWALNNTGQAITTAPQPGTGTLYPTNNPPGTSRGDLDIQPAWDHITDCSSVIVAVVDSGVNYNNTDLAANMWNGNATHGMSFVGGTTDPMDLNGHGTHVAGIIGAAGNNGTGTTGVCWKATIMAVRVADPAGSLTSATAAAGIDFAVSNGAKVINLSFGGPAFDPVLSNSISNAQLKGVIVVAAAGNEGVNNDAGATPTYPCNYTQANVICVAALDQAFQLASFSNYGALSVDVGAPGTNILNTWAGTSAQIVAPLNTGWTFSPPSGGWTPATYSDATTPPTPILIDPPTWPGGLYNNGTDDRAYQTVNLTGVNSAVLSGAANINLLAGDSFNVAYRAAGGDPFDTLAGGTVVGSLTNLATPLPPPLAVWLLTPVDISPCIGATCSIGVQLLTNASGQAAGLALTSADIQTLTLNNPTSENTLKGTSMATPHAAGVAAMVMAYNPADTYQEVVNAVKLGGRAVAALAGKTTTGRAVDALGAVAYINPPTGLSASVQ